MATKIPQPPIAQQLEPSPERITIGVRNILDHIVDSATTRPKAVRVSTEEQQHLKRIAELARELRKELRELAALQDKAG